ncbi:hypothetical protein [Luteimonas abyssi]|uniref:hypothetical protein n=1 Tax=Luteimonas abyssi TaxID=1247514 RepID=UPI000737CE4E|nr:hypothetical protein [Luteimonas abyssi]
MTHPPPLDDAALRRLDGAGLEQRYEDLRQRIFARYEDVERAVERGEATQAAATEAALVDVEPLIAQARRLHDERVRRLRARARRWWIATASVALAGSALVLWLLARS